MYALYVCLTCTPYMYGLYVWLQVISEVGDGVHAGGGDQGRPQSLPLLPPVSTPNPKPETLNPKR